MIKRVGHFEAKFWVEGLCFASIYGPLDRRMARTQKSLFEPPIDRLRDNVRTPSIARWKARSRLSIRDN